MSKIEYVKDSENVWKNIESIWKKNFVIFKLLQICNVYIPINALGKYIFTKDAKFSHIDSIGTQ